jgi:hypothetical protein
MRDAYRPTKYKPLFYNTALHILDLCVSSLKNRLQKQYVSIYKSVISQFPNPSILLRNY